MKATLKSFLLAGCVLFTGISLAEGTPTVKVVPTNYKLKNIEQLNKIADLQQVEPVKAQPALRSIHLLNK